MPLKFTYLAINLLIVLPSWLALFWWRKDLRKEMLIIGSGAAISGFALEWLVWTKDWWNPPTITGTPAGIEDIILGFGVGGIAAVIFEEWFGYKHKKQLPHNISESTPLWAIGASFAFVGFGTILFALGIHSFWASIIAIAVTLIPILITRSDLIIDSLGTGAIAMLASIPLYLIAFALTPEFQPTIWQWHNISGITLFKIPIEDLVWFFFTGAILAPIYEFWYKVKLVKSQ